MEKGRVSLDMRDNLRISKEMSMIFTCLRSRKENIKLKKVNQSRPDENLGTVWVLNRKLAVRSFV